MKKLLCSQENYEEKETNRKPIQYIVVRRYVEQQHHTSECSNILSSKPIAVELLGAVFCDNPSTCGQKEKKLWLKSIQHANHMKPKQIKINGGKKKKKALA